VHGRLAKIPSLRLADLHRRCKGIWNLITAPPKIINISDGGLMTMIQTYQPHDALNFKPQGPDLLAYYEANFDVMPADNQNLLRQAYRLRYQVYCIENAFENPDEYPNGYECDAEDDRSAHVLLVHRRSGTFAGTARVILPVIDGASRPLPIHRILTAQRLDFSQRLPLSSTAEISRFAISKAFRRRLEQEQHGAATLVSRERMSLERHMAPFITFGLIRGVLEICKKRRITHLGAVVEPALMRILRRFGGDFRPIGGLIEHHGMRQACWVRAADFVRRDTLLDLYTRQSVAPSVATCSL
jgi:N-acyl amino acid synthase of PEP-CTERM/exosortase system